MQKKIEILKYDFTPVEISEMSRKLAYETKNIQEIEERKKSVMADFTSKLTESKAIAGRLANNINNGYDYREIECEIVFNTPIGGRKTTSRIDTGEVVRVEDMSLIERQGSLFPLPPQANEVAETAS
jgi:hypothetical protein